MDLVVLGLSLRVVEDADFVTVVDVTLRHAVVFTAAGVVLLSLGRLDDILDLYFGLRSVRILDHN